jgi:hypothetical protein
LKSFRTTKVIALEMKPDVDRVFFSVFSRFHALLSATENIVEIVGRGVEKTAMCNKTIYCCRRPRI